MEQASIIGTGRALSEMIKRLHEARIHMVGIGGSGMSAMASYLRDSGAEVSGTDRSDSSSYGRLKGKGIRLLPPVEPGMDVPGSPDLVIHTAAVSEDHPEVAWAVRKGVKTVKYASMLGAIMEQYEGIAVAGTHGKTSVSALAAHLLKAAERSPSYVFGGYAPDLNGGGGCGLGSHFIAEACEFDRSFLCLSPAWAIITNIEPDHLDYYGTFESLIKAFEEFTTALASRGGRLIISPEAATLLNPGRFSGLDVITYGFEGEADLVVRPFEDGTGFSLCLHGEDLGSFLHPQRGRHNVLNAAAACLLALLLDVPSQTVKQALVRYRGVNRRLENRGVFGGVRILSDYAHHPTEIRAVLDTLRATHPQSRLVVAYQGHQRWRTKTFLDAFSEVLARFDLSLVLETFSVREKDVAHLPEGRDLVDRIVERGGNSLFVGGLVDAGQAIVPQLREGDVLVLMGAGSIDEISGEVEEALSRP